MITQQNKFYLYILSLLFVVFNTYFLWQKDFSLLFLVPVGLYLIFAAFYHTDKVLLSIFFLAPLSMNVEDFGGYGIGMYLPTEPILFGLSLLFIMDQIRRPTLSCHFYRHPVTVSILLYLAWLLITSVTSTRPEVSLKFIMVRIWFFVPLYFYGSLLLSKNLLKNFRLAMWLYLVPLTGVVIYTLIRHATYGFEEDPGHWVMTPFYKDHTSYGAIIALFIPVAFGFLFNKDTKGLRFYILIVILLILLIGFYFSYTRAAWLSLLCGIGVFTILKLKIHYRYVLIAGMLGIVCLYAQWDNIIMNLERNKAEHTTENFEERLESVSNITTDASNLERINRWNSALSMWQEKPLFGYGPGTYAMEYAPHQHPKDITIISSNFGDKGNAHSEYLGTLAEAGLPGALLFVGIVFFIFYISLTLYHKLEAGQDKNLLLIIIVALTGYFIHSALNNYLDTDKAAVPVWIMVAYIVVLHLKQNKKSLFLNK